MHRLSLSSLVLLACAATSGCTDQETTIWITQVSAPAFDDGFCSSSGTPLTNSSWTGTGSYVAFLTIANAIRSNATDVANDTNWVQLQGIEVTINDSSGNTLVDAYSVPVGGTIPSAGGAGELSEASISAVVIPSGMGTFTAGQYIIATIVPFGTTLGGLEVEGPPFSWPIQIVAPTACSVCPDEASGIDQCSPGQDGSCTVLAADDPSCAA